MSYRNPQPDRSKAGAARDRLPTVADRALVAERALTADTATEATTASESIAVSKLSPRGTMDGSETLALVDDDGRVQPLSLVDLEAWLNAWLAAKPKAFPVGTVVITTANTNPGAAIGYGTWEAVGSLLVLLVPYYHWKRTA